MLFKFFIVAIIALQISADENPSDELKVSVYYESFCPDSIKFITTQLEPGYEILGDSLLNIDFVPFGVANATQVNGTWNFECQHGPQECYGNRVQSCVLHLNPQEKAVEFIFCAMGSGDAADDEILEQMKKRSLAGNVAIGFFILAFILIAAAFATPSWLVSDYRINSAKLDRLGLWRHCFRSLADPYDISQRDQHRFFVGCRWIFDPFTTGYDRIRGYLIPDFMIATQFFFTLTFIAVLLSAILTLLYFLCCGPDQKQFVLLIKLNAWILLAGGLCGAIAVIVFAACANKNDWMPGHDNNFFGYSFVLACIGVIACLVCSTMFFTDGYIQDRKKRQMMESQTRFELERETKA